MVCVKATCKVAVRPSQRQVVALMIILLCQVTFMHSSILHVNFVFLDVPNRITCHLHLVLDFQSRICAALKLLLKNKLLKSLCGTMVMNTYLLD